MNYVKKTMVFFTPKHKVFCFIIRFALSCVLHDKQLIQIGGEKYSHILIFYDCIINLLNQFIVTARVDYGRS
ncbi:protein of unknown function [Xenorhabdus bovienii]|uniref:Uncharacterized protein n=1 Tax=Xenorhabdus bovienii TaxID=40576 RepID=A0A0B6XED2_XENBV|nr:protein of unknown function [Xenorhabdus bovienii]